MISSGTVLTALLILSVMGYYIGLRRSVAVVGGSSAIREFALPPALLRHADGLLVRVAGADHLLRLANFG